MLILKQHGNMMIFLFVKLVRLDTHVRVEINIWKKKFIIIYLLTKTILGCSLKSLICQSLFGFRQIKQADEQTYIVLLLIN